MIRPTLLFIFAVMLIAAGCSGKEGTLSAAKNEPNILGKWKGKIEMPEAEKDNPMAKMGEAMMSMFTDNITLEFMEGNTYRLAFMGIPVEGKYERKGLEMTLNAEKAMGMPVEEVKKSNPTFKQEKLNAKISADGTKITIVEPGADASKGNMVFERHKEEPAKAVTSTVKDSELQHVGSYSAKLEGTMPAGLSEEKQQEYKMAESMMGSISLDLLADNTFKMNLMVQMEGTWKADGDTLSLHPTKVMGLPDTGKSDKNEDMKFKVESGGRLIPIEKQDSGMKFVFLKK